jgi:nitrate reductase delta subunit
MDALAELEARAPSDDLAKIDEDWEEKAVTFTRPSHEMGGPTGVVAKIRAAGKAMAAGVKSGTRS